MKSRYERERDKLVELEEKQQDLRSAGMPKRHPESQLLQKQRNKQFEAAHGYPVGCICPDLKHGTSKSCPAAWTPGPNGRGCVRRAGCTSAAAGAARRADIPGASPAP